MEKSVNRREFLSVMGMGAVGVKTLTGTKNNSNVAVENVQAGKLIIYPVPPGEDISGDYKIEINGKPIAVQTAKVNDPPNDKLDYGGKYSFINFDFEGSIRIKISSKRSLEMLQIRPIAKRIKKRVINDNVVELMLNSPNQLVFEPEGKRHPLLIFANRLEVKPPSKSNPNVIYFGPGIHKPEGGVINLKSNQTIYLAGGAVVNAAIKATDVENITIRGRGILDATPWEHNKGPEKYFVNIIKAKNVTVEGVVLRGSFSWTLVLQNCDNVTVENIKICGGRVKNDDGIDPVNTRNMSIKNCFIRSDDDCIALKGLRNEWGDVDGILVENSVLWNDRSMIARFGVESRTPKMKKIVFRNIDIVHYGRQAFNFEPLNETILQDALFEDIRIEGDGQKFLIAIMPVLHPYRANTVPGHIRNIHFKKIKLTGAWGDFGYPDMSNRTAPEYTGLSHPYVIEVGYYDDKHLCQDITFEDFTVLGDQLTRDTPRLLVKSGSTVSVK